ncbi:MAG TPA: tetratricopeptide repeat protein [Myxococcales bacterium]|jgi:type IV pilus assembly protein PilF|nr:tetratricopeptide repeat protein [Myxococcales bacterium]
MLQEDPQRTHLLPDPERIVALYEATNQPLVQPTGRSAQAAQAAVVALREGAVFDVVVALTLTDSGENVIYAGPMVARKDVQQAVEEALNFAESMGFILDQSGWTKMDAVQRAELLDRLPAFWPPSRKAQTHAEPARESDPMQAVARLFAAFCALLLVACSGMSAEQRAQGAQIHQELGDNLLSQGDAQGALKEYMTSVDMEETPEAHNGLGLIYWYSLGRPDDGEKQFKRALEMNPDYSDAMTNLGALYIARTRFADAVPLLEKAARDPLYKTRTIAQTNLGWALYKAGHAERGIGEIRGALAVAPKYCLGWRQLGTIYSEQGRLEEATQSLSRYAQECPDVADAHLMFGKILARQQKAKQARAEFEQCAVAKQERDQTVAAECARFLKELGAP